MKNFFAQSVEKANTAQQRQAVLRFIALWKCRYKVWPAIGERGQKKFNSEREGEERQVSEESCVYNSAALISVCMQFKYYSTPRVILHPTICYCCSIALFPGFHLQTMI